VKTLDRIYHPWDKWECHRAGMHQSTPLKGMDKEECEELYRGFLADTLLFSQILRKVTTEWLYSCEHNLTNITLNRIAWLGQASVCYHIGVPSCFRGGFNKLSDVQQASANLTAVCSLNEWLRSNDYEQVTPETVLPNTKARRF